MRRAEWLTRVEAAMTAKPYEMWSAAVDSRLSPVEVTVELSMETTGRLLNVAGTCRRWCLVRSLPVASLRVVCR